MASSGKRRRLDMSFTAGDIGHMRNGEILKIRTITHLLRGISEINLLLMSLVKKSDYVINFAAESHVDRSINNPEIFIKSNVLGT